MVPTIDSPAAMPCFAPQGELPINFPLLMRRCMGRVELVDRLLASFDDRLPKELAEVEACLAAGDGERLCRLTHQLKGTTANVSAMELLALASRVDASARVAKFDDVVRGLTEIRAAWRRLQDYKAAVACTGNATAGGCGS